ncbi:putative mediator of RNA polymerase II transcription subunit 33A/B [Helianthus debilis subsp. tardiflorus]
MAVTLTPATAVWDGVMEMTKCAQSNGTDPLIWAAELSSSLISAGISLPSPEVAQLLVSHICWSNNVPIAWKLLEKAIAVRLAPPLLVLALLSNSVIPSRRSQPAAYRLYLELLRRLVIPSASEVNGPKYHEVMKAIDGALHLSQRFGIPSSEPGILLVEFIFVMVWRLLDASLDDEGLLELVPEKKSTLPVKPQAMEIDDHNIGAKKIDFNDRLFKSNTTIAIEVIGELYRNKITSRILYLAHRNMPVHWGSFVYNLRLLAAKSISLRNSKHITPEALLQLTSDNRALVSLECKMVSLQQFHAVMASGSLVSPAGPTHNSSHSVIWLPIDLFLEDIMEGTVVATTSAAETLTGLLKAHQAITQGSWQDAFLGLWIAALRLVQREEGAVEGPIPRLDACLCVLLCITTLAIVNIVDEEESALIEENEHGKMHMRSEKQVFGNCRKSLVSSLQQLGDFEGLLTPPSSVTSLVNQAAAKAMFFFSGLGVGSGYLDGVSLNDMPVTCAGDLRHLIVEACIARHLLDTSAYMWPGYVKGHTNQLPPRPVTGQMPGWSSLMKGSPLTSPMVHALVSTPASSLAEIEKLYGIATDGSIAEKISAATILCGASLTRGWNIQEHTGFFIIKLLSPPVPRDYSGTESHLLACAPYLNVLLLGITFIDCIHIFSLHGLVPQLAGVLMPICEVFGSCSPAVSWTLPTGEHLCPLAVFSNAFTLLLKLWRFDQPPFERVGDINPVGSQLTPEFLLLARNSQLSSCRNSLEAQKKRKRVFRQCDLASAGPVFLDSFPKLKFWYRQHQACIASTLSDLKPGTSVYQIFDALLNLMFRKINRGGQSLNCSTSGSSNSSGSVTDDCTLRLKLPAWDIMEAVPFALDAALAACAYGRLSPRELTTGLKDLADFLPASMVTIVSYLSAETTRGLWKPASMNGTDWPSPAANLSMVEKNINKILAETGVDVPSLFAGETSSATLPLPLAALVSLTITYKVDRITEPLLNLSGPALNTLGACCPWPCMPIIVALWTQKAKRWTDFLVFSASRTVFHQNNDAVVQLLRVCFQSILGLNSPSVVTNNGGIGNLLGHGYGSRCTGGMTPVAPGILYLRVHRSVRDLLFMTEEIVSLLIHSVKDILTTGIPIEKIKKPKSETVLRYGEVSLSAVMTRIKVAASLGASLVWITGGLNLVQTLIKETLPSWFISVHRSDQNKVDCGGMIGMLKGYALAYFTILSGAFAWGVDSASSASKKRPFILGAHLEFMVSALDGKISLGCNKTTWRAYVSGFVSLMVSCTPKWVREVDVTVLRSLSKGLRKWDEEELALALLEIGGVGAMGAAAEFIIENLLI